MENFRSNIKLNYNSELEEKEIKNEIYIRDFNDSKKNNNNNNNNNNINHKNNFNIAELNELLNYKAPMNVINSNNLKKLNKNEEEILFNRKEDYSNLLNINKILKSNLEKNKKEYYELVR